jgi:dTDP-4-dehydrorhamnose 3,5-epimerase
MKIIKKIFANVFLIKNNFQKDKRGKFIKFNSKIKIRNKDINFNQFCYSLNKNKLTLRGLHFQKKPFQEEKLITCVKGKILDVVMDINKYSKTYLQYKFINLNEKNMYSLYIGKDYAHGFLTLTKDTSVLYQIKGIYIRSKQSGLSWNDPSLKIKWPAKPRIISIKDKKFKNINL